MPASLPLRAAAAGRRHAGRARAACGPDNPSSTILTRDRRSSSRLSSATRPEGGRCRGQARHLLERRGAGRDRSRWRRPPRGVRAVRRSRRSALGLKRPGVAHEGACTCVPVTSTKRVGWPAAAKVSRSVGSRSALAMHACTRRGSPLARSRSSSMLLCAVRRRTDSSNKPTGARPKQSMVSVVAISETVAANDDPRSANSYAVNWTAKVAHNGSPTMLTERTAGRSGAAARCQRCARATTPE